MESNNYESKFYIPQSARRRNYERKMYAIKRDIISGVISPITKMDKNQTKMEVCFNNAVRIDIMLDDIKLSQALRNELGFLFLNCIEVLAESELFYKLLDTPHTLIPEFINSNELNGRRLSIICKVLLASLTNLQQGLIIPLKEDKLHDFWNYYCNKLKMARESNKRSR